jgi:acetyltransferase-like isoleucine patch superfamily enzyme
LTVDGMVKPWPNPVEIGNNVWVGTGATVLPGVRVEDGAVVGAGSVVTHQVPARTVVAGNPAKVIGKDVDWVK